MGPFRVLGVEYAKRYDLAHVPPVEVQEELTNPTDVSSNVQAEQDARKASDQAPLEVHERQVELFEAVGKISSINDQLGEMMGDAPMCDVCGHITVRNGACYKCLNCGASMGCS